jgi:hypothetical protein
MSQYQQQGDLEVFNSILQAAEFGKPRYVTGNTDDNYFTEPLVQNVFGADPWNQNSKGPRLKGFAPLPWQSGPLN